MKTRGHTHAPGHFISASSGYTGGFVGRREVPNVLKKSFISYSCWDSNPRSPSPYPSHYTDYTETDNFCL